MGGPINPIDGIDGNRRREGPEPPGQQSYRRTLHGVVVSVRAQNRPRREGHLLDATVGEQDCDEIVVRVSRGDPRNLQGKHVIVSLEG